MKYPLALFQALALAAALSAQPMHSGRGPEAPDMNWLVPEEDRGRYFKAEQRAVEAELGARRLGELTVAELAPYRDRLELAARKDQYVQKLALRSYAVPGSGQIETGDAQAGAAFACANAVVSIGGLLGVYFLLPRNLRLDHLNYYRTPLNEIRRTWESHSVEDYLPAAGLGLGTMLVDQGIRFWSARDAVSDAKSAVDSGSAKLEPLAGPGFFGFRYVY